MNIVELERLVRRGAASLAESLHFYWPSTGNNEIAEANVALHLGRAFLERDFLVLAEAHGKDGVKLHLDLLSIDPMQGVFVAGEFKRLHNGSQLRSMLADLDRVLGFSPHDDDWHLHPGITPRDCWGILAGTTWLENLAQWFVTDDDGFVSQWPELHTLEKRIGEVAADGERIFNAFPLQRYHLGARQDRVAGYRTQWLVYALFRVPTGVPS